MKDIQLKISTAIMLFKSNIAKRGITHPKIMKDIKAYLLPKYLM